MFDRHYRRLVNSATALRLPIPEERSLAGWVREIAEEANDGIVRVLLTRGGAVPNHEEPGQCIVLWHPLPTQRDHIGLFPTSAPWHPGGFDWELAGVKTISYAPNQAASRAAVEAGFDDALLISREGVVLDGPTFSVAWVVEENLEIPEIGLGILESVTVGLVREISDDLGIRLVEGRYDLERLKYASEVMVMSTVKEICPVSAVGEWTYQPGPVAKALLEAYHQRVHGP
jgi:4-amino-4-deoxychorismate lyase